MHPFVVDAMKVMDAWTVPVSEEMLIEHLIQKYPMIKQQIPQIVGDSLANGVREGKLHCQPDEESVIKYGMVCDDGTGEGCQRKRKAEDKTAIDFKKAKY